MPRCYVSVGSNVDKENNIPSALNAMRAEFRSVVTSIVYLTEPVGFDGADFHNLVTGFDTELTPQQVIAALRAIESGHGRVRGNNRYAPRTLDLDLLLYGDLVETRDGLELPSREITRYAFVLRPLAEIAGNLRHPRLGKTVRELWREADLHDQPMQAVDGGLRMA